MELRQVRYFLTVAEEGHFTRAAEKLYVSQPNLSQQIRQLEAELNVTLLDRAGRSVRLTAAGEVFAHHARRMLQELEQAQIALHELAGLRRGALAIGVVQTVNAYLMPDVIAAFAATYPGITLSVEEQAAGEIENGIVKGSFQLGIGFLPTTAEEIEAEPLFTEELVLIVPQGHRLCHRLDITVRELDGLPMILLPPRFCTRRLWDACAQQAGIQPRVIVEVNTIASILAAVRQMQVATILPALALPPEQERELVGIALRDPTPQRTVGLLYRRGGYRCAATRAFARVFWDVATLMNPMPMKHGHTIG